MKINIKNCNNIDEANISVEIGRLNIKYGANGTGKSTIAKAIELTSKKPIDLSSLTQFKFRSLPEEERKIPSIEGIEAFKSISVFNEDYVSQFVFKQDEVLKNSFDIFIKNQNYKDKMLEIQNIVSEIKETYENDSNIDDAIKDLSDLEDSFGKSQTGYSKAGRIGKGVGGGNKIENIPATVEHYKNYIKSECNVKWIKWQIEGNEFLEISTECPYCVAPTDKKKDSILAISKEYDAKSIEHLVALQGIISRLGKYLSEETIRLLTPIINNKDGLTKEEIGYLTGLKNQVTILKEKLRDIKSISFFSLRDSGKVQEHLENLKINIELLPLLNSEESRKIIEEVNASLDIVTIKAGKLQGEVNKQKNGIETAILKYKLEINSFLRYAGYKYVVEIQAENEEYKMKLRHVDFSENIQNGNLHLSYGERNAFSIVLFMYECLTRNPDLIILDDPISSFDKSKKFAILEMLFRGKDSFRGKTTIMLTHDIEPIIDMVKSLSHTFQPSPLACFLKTKKGIIEELIIEKKDVTSFGQICDENMALLDSDIIKIIYLRRQQEILNDKGIQYQLLSNLLHKRQVPMLKEDGTERIMSEQEIDCATIKIREKIISFDYEKILAEITNNDKMTFAYKNARNSYEKLQIFRIINNENHENDVVKKYINESFHIENDYIMQLNPHKYDFIPEHIISECDLSFK